MTFNGAVVGCEPTAAGPRGLARWRKESASTIIFGQTEYIRRLFESQKPVTCVIALCA